jgi:hypothetical protein
MFALHLHRSLLRVTSAAPLVAVAAGVAAIGLGGWLGMSDRAVAKEERGARMMRAVLDEKIARTQQRIEQLEVELPPEQERAMRAEKLVAELKGVTNTWSWFGGNREQQRLNRERLAKMEALHVEAAAKAAALQQELQRLRWENEAFSAERARVDAVVQAEDERKTSAWHRVRDVWLGLRGWIVMAAGIYLAGAVAVQAGRRRWKSRRAAAV